MAFAASPGPLARPSRLPHPRWWPVVLVAGVAFALRVVPVLAGGGLFGLMGYDASVYYAASAGLAHGLLPYRDYLLLHPPGITIALLPFTALGRLIGDPTAMALARLAWMGLGAVNAVLVLRILRPLGLRAATAGGLFYAVFGPAISIEHAPSLEAVAAACMLGAMLPASRWTHRTPVAARSALLIGVLLGLSTGMKIWGVVVVAVIWAWTIVVVGLRPAVVVGAGAVIGASSVCLPFFLAAPAAMWRMVVLDQLGRLVMKVPLATRIADIAGLPRLLSTAHPWLSIGVSVAAVAACALAVSSRPGRLGTAVLAATVILLLVTPSWFLHYGGLSAAPAAVVVGAAMAPLLGARSRWVPVAARVALAGVVGAFAVAGLRSTPGRAFPAAQLRGSVSGLSGCVTTDDPSSLIWLDVLGQNFRHHCPLTVDLGGYSYDLTTATGQRVARRSNQAWQRHAIAYLRSGDATIILRFDETTGFDPASARTVRSWPVIMRAGSYLIRRPTS